MQTACTETEVMRVVDYQQHIARQLADAGIETALLDARLLIQAGLGWDDNDIVAKREDELTSEQHATLDALTARRIAREPMAYILGERAFWKAHFKVTKDTLIPRPDSETLVETCVKHTPTPKRILDLGTGSGCLLLSLLGEFPNAQGVAVDASKAALAIAQENAAQLGLAERCQCISSDWFASVEGTFDLIISNPPYIESAACEGLEPDVKDHEPRSALDGGADGLADYRILTAQAGDYLNAGGHLALEVGAGQAEAVRVLGEAAGLNYLDNYNDLGGIARVVLFTKPLTNQEEA